MLIFDDGDTKHHVSTIEELNRFIDDVVVEYIGMTTPDGRLWSLWHHASAGSDKSEIYCLTIGEGLEQAVNSPQDIVDFLDSVPTTGLTLMMRHKVFQIIFAGVGE